MQRTLPEKKVLRLLDIPDFRHLTKDKVVTFATMLPRMDPEVAKKALEVIPEYVKLASEMVRTYQHIVVKMFEANATDTQAFYNACNSILSSLQKQLEVENLTFEQREALNDRMITVAKMISEKGLENKRYWISVLGTVGKFMLGTLALVLSIWGIKQLPGDNNKFLDQ